MLDSHLICICFQLTYEVKKSGMMVPFKGDRDVNVQSSAVNIIQRTQLIYCIAAM